MQYPIDRRRRNLCQALLAPLLYAPACGLTENQSGLLAQLDATGSRDCSRLINEALKHGSLVLPPGRFLCTLEPINLANGRSLSGAPSTILVKGSAPNVPLVQVSGVERVTITGLQLRNAYRNVRKVDLRSWERRRTIPVDIPQAWRWPSMTVTVYDSNGRTRFLRYHQDYRIRTDNGGSWLVLTHELPAADQELRYYVQPGLAPLVGVEDATKVTIRDLALEDGAIVYHATTPLSAELLVEGCQITNGQIRIQSDRNAVPQIVDQVHRSSTFDGPRAVSIRRNRISGPYSESSSRRYIEFSERVHGIMVTGGTSGFDVTDNTVTGVPGDGLALQCCVDGDVRGNTVSGNALSGIGIENGTVKRSQKLVIAHNKSIGNWFDGCDLNYGNPLRLDCEQLQRRGEQASHRFTENEFSRNGHDMPGHFAGCGVYASWVRGVVMEDNICNDNNVAGILCQLSSELRILRNKVGGNGRTRRIGRGAGAGIALLGCQEAVVQDNKLLAGGRQSAAPEISSWVGRCKTSGVPAYVSSE